MITDIIEIGPNEESRRPNVPEGYYYQGWQDLGNGTCEVFGLIEPKEIQEQKQEAIRSASQLVIAEKLLSDAIPEDEMERFAPLYDYPVAGQTYKLDWVLRDVESGELFKIAQPQVTWEAHWKIAEIPAIVTPFRKPNTITAWKQPSGAHDAYQIGDKVSHNGLNWESKINANTTVPDGDIPFNRYWGPL